jgi:Na+/H+-dicarboxylate symporter
MQQGSVKTFMMGWFAVPLWKRIILALVLGVIVGAIWGEGAQSIRWIGDLFIRLIQMVVVPLVFITIVSGMVAMGDPQKLGSLGVKTLALYMLTTALAIIIGLSLAAAIQPGIGVDLSTATPGTVQEAIPLGQRLMTIVPSNPIAALAEGNILAVIFFALLFGMGILTVGKTAKPMADIMDAGAAVMLKLTGWVMEVAPFGVFALIAWVSGHARVGLVARCGGIGHYSATWLCAAHCHCAWRYHEVRAETFALAIFSQCQKCHVGGVFNLLKLGNFASDHFGS